MFLQRFSRGLRPEAPRRSTARRRRRADSRAIADRDSDSPPRQASLNHSAESEDIWRKPICMAV